jgi:hypothetical protein
MIYDQKNEKVSTVNMEFWKPRGQAKLETDETKLIVEDAYPLWPSAR